MAHSPGIMPSVQYIIGQSTFISRIFLLPFFFFFGHISNMQLFPLIGFSVTNVICLLSS